LPASAILARAVVTVSITVLALAAVVS